MNDKLVVETTVDAPAGEKLPAWLDRRNAEVEVKTVQGDEATGKGDQPVKG